jgi:hypothetical protein
MCRLAIGAHRGMRVRLVLVFATLLATFVAGLGFAAPSAGAEVPVKVAIIVGPVGEELTPVYLSLADAAADAAESRGAMVARAYSPKATADKVLKAVQGATIVIYFGHGVGTPNPYTDTPSASTTNGWGLNGPGGDGKTHRDTLHDGALTYYGEEWIAEQARPAPGWVMIYSNACYAPGASEGHDEPADEETAAERVSAYSRAPLAELGASAFFATDFYEGAAHLVGALLDEPGLPYGEIFAKEPNFSADGLTRHPHDGVEKAETWLHRSPYFDGKTDYWYAFAGDPAASLGAGGGAVAAAEPASVDGIAAVDGLATGPRAACRARRRDPGRGAAGRARLRRPLRQPAGRRLVPVLCRYARSAGREPVGRRVGAGDRRAARGGPRARRGASLAGRGTGEQSRRLTGPSRP